MKPKLIFVEGLPNSGKSTLLDLIYEFLRSNHIDARALYEDKGINPIEYYSNAFFDTKAYRILIHKHGADTQVLNTIAIKCCGGILVPNWCTIENIPPAFQNDIRSRNFFNLPLDTSIEVMDEIIRRFLSLVENDDITYIVECAMLQNPLRLFLLKNNTLVDELEKRVQDISRLFSRYEIVIFMNHHDEPADIFENNFRRGTGWTGSCVDEITNNEFGRQRNYEGIVGTLAAYQELNDVQLSIFRTLRCRKYLVDNSGYEKGNRDQQAIEILNDLYSV